MKKIALKKLVENGSNPRIIKSGKFKKLVKSIKDFPQMLELRPIIVNEDMKILGGNMRYKACVEAGLEEVPILVAKGLTEEQENEFIIKDNVGYGEWDWDILSNEWNTVELAEWGLDVWQNIDDEIEKVNALDEWVGMPEFEEKEKPLALNIKFETEKDRENFVKKKDIKIAVKKEGGTWSAWWPYKEQQDLKSLKYE